MLSWTAPRSGWAACSLHLDARLNSYRIFNETIEGFELAQVAERQKAALATGVPLTV